MDVAAFGKRAATSAVGAAVGFAVGNAIANAVAPMLPGNTQTSVRAGIQLYFGVTGMQYAQGWM